MHIAFPHATRSPCGSLSWHQHDDMSWLASTNSNRTCHDKKLPKASWPITVVKRGVKLTGLSGFQSCVEMICTKHLESCKQHSPHLPSISVCPFTLMIPHVSLNLYLFVALECLCLPLRYARADAQRVKKHNIIYTVSLYIYIYYIYYNKMTKKNIPFTLMKTIVNLPHSLSTN